MDLRTGGRANRSKNRLKEAKQKSADDLFREACAAWDKGKLARAAELFRASADLGDTSSMLNLGYCFDTARGVKKDDAQALYWYKEAYRRGDSSAASNIGLFYRERGEPAKGLWWLHRSLRMGDEGTALELAKVYFQRKKYGVAAKYLGIVLRSDWVSEQETEDATELLSKVERKLEGLRKKRLPKPIKSARRNRG
jgi:TPR repeat protein